MAILLGGKLAMTRQSPELTVALRQVLANPHSVAARRELARSWRACSDPRAPLIENQLDDYDGITEGRKRARENRQLIDAHGREWAGRVAELAERYRFELGLVAEITIKGDVFLAHAAELVAAAPIVHLDLEGPVDMQRLVATPALAQMSTLTIAGGPWLDDAAAEALAGAATARRLRVIDLSGGNITERGMVALARSPNLRDIVYIELTGNPCQLGGQPVDAQLVNDRFYLMGEAAWPHMQAAHRAAVQSYDPMNLILWPPLPEMFAYDE